MGNDSQEYADKGYHPLVNKPQDAALGEKNLLVAVIERAVRDAVLSPESPILVQGSAPNDARVNYSHHRSAISWLWSNNVKFPGFIAIVRALGLSDSVVHMIRAEIPRRPYRAGDVIKPHRFATLDFSANFSQCRGRAA